MWLNSVLSFLHLEVWQQLSPSRVCPASCAAHGMLLLLLQGRICLYKTRGSAASGWSRPLTAQSVPGIVFLVRLAVNLIEWTSCLGLSLYTLHPLCFFFSFFSASCLCFSAVVCVACCHRLNYWAHNHIPAHCCCVLCIQSHLKLCTCRWIDLCCCKKSIRF